MQFRRAEPTDEDALRLIRQRAILELAVPTLTVEQAEEWANGATRDRMMRAIQEHEVWVAVDNEVIGWVEIDRERIAALYVMPAIARQGIGSCLLSLAETVIGKAGYTNVYLGASQNALGFYLRHGYIHAGPQSPDGSYPLTKHL